jgi:hypothetical protein
VAGCEPVPQCGYQLLECEQIDPATYLGHRQVLFHRRGRILRCCAWPKLHSAPPEAPLSERKTDCRTTGTIRRCRMRWCVERLLDAWGRRKGIDVYPVLTDDEKEQVGKGELKVEALGKSKKAATLAVGETAISRVLNATPIMVLPPLILVRLQKTEWLKQRPKMTTPVNLGESCRQAGSRRLYRTHVDR